MKTFEKILVVLCFVAAAMVFSPANKKVTVLRESPDPQPFNLVSTAPAQVPPTPVKISSLTQVATAPNNALLMLTIPGVTNYVITIANFKTDLATTFGTNTVVLSNAFVVSLSALSNYVNSLVATNSSQFQSNIMVAWTNFANWLVVSNNANIGGDTYVSGNVYANSLLVTNDSHFKDIYVSGFAYISHVVVTNEISVDEVDTDTIVVTNYVQVPTVYVSNTGYFSNIVVTNLTFPTNWSVVLSGANTSVSVTTTNGTNFYTVNANATSFLNSLVITNGLFQTNRTVTVATNATVILADFMGAKDWYEVPVFYNPTVTVATTNLIAGRELWFFFGPSNSTANLTVSVLDMTGLEIFWNYNSTTNGNSDLVVTNGGRSELCLTVRSNNILHAVYGHYR